MNNLLVKREWEPHEKDWGLELWLENNSLYCGKMFVVKKGWVSSMHKHQKKTETFTILSGVIILETPQQQMCLQCGDCVTIPKGSFHSFAAAEDALVIETSTPHSEKDVIRKTFTRKLSAAEFGKILKAATLLRKPSVEDHISSLVSLAPQAPKSLGGSRNGQRTAGNRRRYSGNASKKAVPAPRDARSKPRKGARD